MAFSCQQVRKLIMARGYMLDAGFGPDDPAIRELTIIRDEYLARVGMETYLSEMLTTMEHCTMEMCSVTWESGQSISGWDLTKGERFQRCYTWLVARCRVGSVPYKIVAHLGGGHTAVRFL